MTLTQTVLGARLRDARINAGLTQEAAAEAVDLPRISLLQIEAGKRALTSLELIKLARLYHRDISTLLSEEEPESEDPLVVLCRVEPAFAEQPEVRQVIARNLEWVREGIVLERLLGNRAKPVPPIYNLPTPRGWEDAIEQGQTVALEERQRLNLGMRPLPDVADILSREGIWAAAVPLPDEVSGLFLARPDVGLAVLVNQKHRRGRRRFSYSHEYAHALLDRQREPTTVTSRRTRGELIEKRANAFAGEFLIPSAGVHALLEQLDRGGPSRETFWVWDVATAESEHFERRNAPGSQTIGYQDVAYVANEFQVSYDAAVNRLSDMRLINREEREALLRYRADGHQFIRLLKLQDPDDMDGETLHEQPRLVSQIARIAVEAVRREAISGGRFLDICEKLNLAAGEELLELARVTQA